MDEEQNHEEFSYELKIPEERVAVLVGTDGQTKKEIEEQTGCKLDIDSEGAVTIYGDDGLKLFDAKNICKAIARGFNPKIALLLLKPDYSLELIELKDVAGKSKNELLRLKGRIIGKGGRSREEVERLTNTYIVVYGKTVGIIGEVSWSALARQAVGMLIDGAMHRTVYRFLEKKKKEMLFG
jgi:ribosomal RNA assembly protein